MSPRAFCAAFSMRMKNNLQYRTAAYAGLTTQFFWGFMFIMIYRAFYQSGASQSPMTLAQLTDYTWLRQAFLAVVMSWSRDNELMNMIVSGQVSYELCRPVHIYDFWYARVLAQRFAGAALRFGPVLALALLLPKGYGLRMPASWEAFALFVLTLLGAGALMSAISMLIYASIFKTMSPLGSFSVAGVLIEFFSGNILPLPFMPAWLSRIAYALPFRYVSDLPFRVWSGSIAPGDAWPLFALQLCWIAVFFLLGRFIMGRLSKKLVLQGG